jgi:thioesterase domain-containing protein
MKMGGTQQPPIFCIHHVDGLALSYAALAKHLAPEMSVYGVQAPQLCGQQITLTTVEEMARHYVAEIRRVWPEGPYRLCGLSFGGIVAFEMAVQMQALGLPVEFVGLLDTYAPDYWRTKAGIAEGQLPLLLRTREKFDLLRSLSHDGRKVYLQTSVKRVFRKIRETLPALQGLPDNEIAGFLPGAMEAIRSTNEQAQRDYFPRSYARAVTLFRAKEQLGRATPDPLLWWGGLAERVDICKVNGNHYTLVDEPFVRGLASAMRECLSKGVGA